MRLLALLLGLAVAAVSYTPLSDESLRSIADPGSDFDIHKGALLAPILVPRVPGTPGSLKVLEHFVDFFRTSLPKWNVTIQNSTFTTPTSNGAQVPFRNLIATRDPPWTTPGQVPRLALVAHYDSLSVPEGFIGAIDSAAPCAMIMHAVRSIDDALTRKWVSMQAAGAGSKDDLGDDDYKGIQVILLDGEEAFLSWTATDSVYGARALASEWESEMYPAMSTYHSPLAAIDLFVLLDLLGAASPTIPSYFKTTHWAYRHMADVEKRLRKLDQFKSLRPREEDKRRDSMFLNEADKTESARWLGGFIGDDHVPFMEKGVEVLHLIPAPFPPVWHKATDDGEHLDIPTVHDWARLITAFSAEWMDLEGFMKGGPIAAGSKDEFIPMG